MTGASPSLRAGRAGGPSDLSRCASQPKALIPDAGAIWSEHLTDKQLLMVIESGDDDGASGYGVELRGPNWTTARSLTAKGLGWIEGGAPNGSDLPGLYFNNIEGVRIAHEFDEEEEARAGGAWVLP